MSVHQLPYLSFPPSFSSLCVCLAFDFLLSTHDYMPCGVLLFTVEMPSSWPPGGCPETGREHMLPSPTGLLGFPQSFQRATFGSVLACQTPFRCLLSFFSPTQSLAWLFPVRNVRSSEVEQFVTKLHGSWDSEQNFKGTGLTSQYLWACYITTLKGTSENSPYKHQAPHLFYTLYLT